MSSRSCLLSSNPFALLDATGDPESSSPASGDGESECESDFEERVKVVRFFRRGDEEENEDAKEERDGEDPKFVEVEDFPEDQSVFPFELLVSDLRKLIHTEYVTGFSLIFFALTSKKYYQSCHYKFPKRLFREMLAIYIGTSGNPRLLSWCFRYRWRVDLMVVIETAIRSGHSSFMKRLSVVKDDYDRAKPMSTDADFGINNPMYYVYQRNPPIFNLVYMSVSVPITSRVLGYVLGQSGSQAMMATFKSIGLEYDIPSLAIGASFSGHLKLFFKLGIPGLQEFINAPKHFSVIVEAAAKGGHLPDLEWYIRHHNITFLEDPSDNNTHYIPNDYVSERNVKGRKRPHGYLGKPTPTNIDPVQILRNLTSEGTILNRSDKIVEYDDESFRLLKTIQYFEALNGGKFSRSLTLASLRELSLRRGLIPLLEYLHRKYNILALASFEPRVLLKSIVRSGDFEMAKFIVEQCLDITAEDVFLTLENCDYCLWSIPQLDPLSDFSYGVFYRPETLYSIKGLIPFLNLVDARGLKPVCLNEESYLGSGARRPSPYFINVYSLLVKRGMRPNVRILSSLIHRCPDRVSIIEMLKAGKILPQDQWSLYESALKLPDLNATFAIWNAIYSLDKYVPQAALSWALSKFATPSGIDFNSLNRVYEWLVERSWLDAVELTGVNSYVSYFRAEDIWWLLQKELVSNLTSEAYLYLAETWHRFSSTVGLKQDIKERINALRVSVGLHFPDNVLGGLIARYFSGDPRECEPMVEVLSGFLEMGARLEVETWRSLMMCGFQSLPKCEPVWQFLAENHCPYDPAQVLGNYAHAKPAHVRRSKKLQHLHRILDKYNLPKK